MGGVLAIDYGERKTGFAAADPARIVIQPLETIRLAGTGGELLDHIQGLLAERDVSHLLVGMPLHADGQAGSQALLVEAFIERARQRFPALTIVTHDEHLTTKEAESRLSAAGYRGREIAARRDSWSAMVLLEDWVQSGEPGGDP